MRTTPIYRVYVNTSNGHSWERHFAGRPNKEEVLAALAQARMRTAKFEYLTTLVQDNGVPEKDTKKLCLDAGVVVGRITVNKLTDAVVVNS